MNIDISELGVKLESIKGIVLLGIDNNIIWNPFGHKKPSPWIPVPLAAPVKGCGWTWGVPEEQRLMEYFNSLWSHNLVPVLWSSSTDLKLISEVHQSLRNNNVKLPHILGVEFKDVYSTIKKAWSLPDNIHLYVINGDNAKTAEIGGVNCTFESIGFKFNERLPIKTSEDKRGDIGPLIVLMGQQGSGKSTVAAQLKDMGYLVYSEIQAGALQRKQVKATTEFKQSLLRLIKETEHGPKLPGIVIDATNPQVKHRQLYMDLATLVGVPYHTGWITRPGWESNKERLLRIPDVALYTYAKRFEYPIEAEKTIRLI